MSELSQSYRKGFYIAVYIIKIFVLYCLKCFIQGLEPNFYKFKMKSEDIDATDLGRRSILVAIGITIC